MKRLLVVVLLAACGPEFSTEAPEAARDAIVGGTDAPNDANVFMLYLQGNNNQASGCTATLIAPRTLLTASHCVDPSILGATSVFIIATNAPTQNDVRWGVNTVRVVDTRRHPTWTPTSLEGDLALALLAEPQPVTPKPWNRDSLSGRVGQALRAVGFGTTGNDEGSGTRRQVNLTLRELSQERFTLGDRSARGVCHGDSGGPSFMTFEDGVERVIGVHSYTLTEACTDGADVRVDFYEDFISEWLTEFEDTCAADGICSPNTCASPDPDCVAPGATCTSASQCNGRRCAADSQRDLPYCTAACTGDEPCSALGMTCDAMRGVCQLPLQPVAPAGAACVPGVTFCADASVCNGPDASNTRCAWRCGSNADCPTNMTCERGVTGDAVCVAPNATVPFAGIVSAPVATGCSTGLGLFPVLMALMLRRRRHA